jgi:hypothetical protein
MSFMKKPRKGQEKTSTEIVPSVYPFYKISRFKKRMLAYWLVFEWKCARESSLPILYDID